MAKHFSKLRPWRPAIGTLPWILACVITLWTCLPLFYSIAAFLGPSAPQPASAIMTLLPEVKRVTIYTIYQGMISAMIIFVFAPLLATALIFASRRQRYWSQVIRLTIFCLPSIVVATGLVLIWGNQGLATLALRRIGVNTGIQDILYSPYAIVIANVMLNLPYASTVVFNAITAISPEYLKSATTMGLSLKNLISEFLWPQVKNSVFYATGLTFLLSINSFGALSILGGSATAQTLELSIFQKIYLEGNLRDATIFAIIHTLLASACALTLFMPRFRAHDTYQISRADIELKLLQIRSLLAPSRWARRCIAIFSGLIDVVFALPVLIVFYEGIFFLSQNLVSQDNTEYYWRQFIFSSVYNSLSFAIPAAVISSSISWIIARSYCQMNKARRFSSSKTLMMITLSSSIIPSMAAGFGMLAMRIQFDISDRFFSIIFLHIAMILPFLVNFSITEYSRYILPFENSKWLLGLSTSRWFNAIEFPNLCRVIPKTFAIGLCLSMSETSVVSLLAENDQPTLTMSMIQLMSRYRFNDSALASSMLVLITFSMIAILTQSKKREHASPEI